MMLEITPSMTDIVRLFKLETDKSVYVVNKLKRALHAYDVAKRKLARKRCKGKR